MGVRSSTQRAHANAKARNDEIEVEIEHDRLMAENEVQLLFLGKGQSEISTIIRHMKLMHHEGYNDQQRGEYKEILFHNATQSMQAVLYAMPILELSLQPGNDTHRATILSLPIPYEGASLSRKVSDAIRRLWADPGVREAVKRGREFKLNESAMYYFNAIDRMSFPGHLPTDQDILQASVKTTGIMETVFRACRSGLKTQVLGSNVMNHPGQIGELTYRFLDVSGLRPAMKKWIPCFENVNAVVFVVSLSDYKEVLYEDESVNRLQESLTQFDVICNSRWFIRTSIILLLNNIDKFAKILPISPLNYYFPDYTGGDNYDAACDYILHQFLSLSQSTSTRQIYVHYTSTTDTTRMKFITSTMQDIQLQEHLRSLGLLDPFHPPGA